MVMKNNHLLRVMSALLMVMCMMFSLTPTTFLADKVVRDIPEDAIYLSTPEDVLELAENCKVNTWSVGKTVVLNTDIDMSGYEFNGISTFGGIFVGKGFTIKGLDMKADGSVVGFFRYLQESAIVEYVNFEGTILPSGSRSVVGGIAGRNAGTIQGCSFKGTVSGNKQIGGLAGINEVTGTVEDCTVSGMVYGNHFVGGVVGENHGVVRNTKNYAEINTLSVQNSVALEDITIDSLINTENASTTTDIGGIAGSNSGVIRGSINNGAVGYQHMGYNIGGIAGTQSGYIVDCTNNAEIQGRKEIGGIVGHMEPYMVLDYDADSLQILSGQMDDIQDSMNQIGGDLKSNGDEINSQVEGLKSDFDEVESALERLSEVLNAEVVDPDQVIAASNDLSAAVQDAMSNASSVMGSISSSTSATINRVTGEMENVVAKMEDVMMTMSTLESGLGFLMEDISGLDTEADVAGKVANCVNFGNISGDLNIGGIAGILSAENDLDTDTEILGNTSLNATYQARAVVRDCKNYGTISAGKQAAGGIVGQMAMGAVLESINLGNLDSLNADYVGGIAGDSSAIIRNCGTKSVLAGGSYVGGIAGRGNEVKDCYAFVDIRGFSEKAGAVLGSANELPAGVPEDKVIGNKFFVAENTLGGIDDISYTGATDALSVEEFLQLENLDEGFLAVNVTFKVEGQVDVVKSVPVGGNLSLDQVPVLEAEDDSEYAWEVIPAVTSQVLGMGEVAETDYLSEESLTGILFDQTYEVSFDAKGTVISSADKTDKNLPVLLAVGSFAKNTTVEMQDMMSGEGQINGKDAIINYQISVSNIGVEKLHYNLAGLSEESVKLFVKDASGNWVEREFVIDGSYMVFAFEDGEMAFALVKDAGAMVGQVITVVVVVVVLIAVLVLVKKLRKRTKK